MPPSIVIAHFFGGVFFANALPHLIAGVSGLPLQTPFASPPFRGLSSPVVNIGWALFNLVAAYLLLVRVGTFDLHSLADVSSTFLGFGLWALQCARAFHKIRSKKA